MKTKIAPLPNQPKNLANLLLLPEEKKLIITADLPLHHEPMGKKISRLSIEITEKLLAVVRDLTMILKDTPSPDHGSTILKVITDQDFTLHTKKTIVGVRVISEIVAEQHLDTPLDLLKGEI